MTKWQKTAEHGADEIREALEEALALLEDPAEAYLRATPDTRRLFNQALFEKLIIHEIGPVTGQATRWVSAFESVARIKTRQIYGRPKPGDSTSGKNEPATSDEKVTGSNDFKLVQRSRRCSDYFDTKGVCLNLLMKLKHSTMRT
jgi:hypothetical protein